MNWREREAEAAATLRECRAALAARGSTVIREMSRAGVADIIADIVDWRHYPEGEVYDPASHAQYFYHRHPAPARKRPAQPAEHGHFHLFLRGEGMPAGITPLLMPELAVANAPAPRQSAPLKLGRSDEVCHLVALAVDGKGEPLRLFTTNRWVTGETWYRADDVIRMLDRFRVRGERPSALLKARDRDAVARSRPGDPRTALAVARQCPRRPAARNHLEPRHRSRRPPRRDRRERRPLGGRTRHEPRARLAADGRGLG